MKPGLFSKNQSNLELCISRPISICLSACAFFVASFLAGGGFYEPVYEFADLPRFEKEIMRIRDRQKDMLKLDGENGNKGAAAYFLNLESPVAYQRQPRESAKLIKNILRLMLRAFN